MDSRKVVWAEGMFLRPQHFQQQERYLEFFAHSRALASEGYFWGFHELEIDVEALALGKLVLNKAVGIFPDGTPFSMPGTDTLPEPLEILPNMKGERVFLSLPMRRLGTVEVEFDAHEVLARYRAADAELSDCNSEGGEPAPAQLAHMRSRLLPQSASTDSWLQLGVTEIVDRRSDGTVLLESRHIPPSVSYGQSALLQAMVDDIAGLLQTIRQELALRDVTVMVCGDPGYYSLLETFRRELPQARIRVIPGISSFQLAFARIGLPWQTARLLSAHGRKPAPSALVREPGMPLSFLTDARQHPAVIASWLQEQGWPPTARVWLCKNLSYPDETVAGMTLAEALKISGFESCVMVVME